LGEEELTAVTTFQKQNAFASMRAAAILNFSLEAQLLALDQEWVGVLQKVQGFRTLADGWDGLAAEAPSLDVVDAAMRLAATLRALGYPAPSAMPGADGTILFIWEEGPVYLDAEVTGPSRARWMQVVKGQKAKHWLLYDFTPEGLQGMGQTPIVFGSPLASWTSGSGASIFSQIPAIFTSARHAFCA
jgi:hypothetical protein